MLETGMERMIHNESDTKRFGLELAEKLKPGDVIALIGDLGTGKTTLTKSIAEGLGITEMITSPTFTIVQEYHEGRLPLYHFDVYRIRELEEMYELGYEEYFFGRGVCIVEWADQIMELIPENSIIIRIEYGSDEEERVYRIENLDLKG
jgi:tRNA threonylcarbamoyladenosine biosynthesis protein TsaE